MNEPLFLGRQPILDRNQGIVAFELLFRSGDVNHAQISDDFTATATVINHAFNEFGIEAALGPYKGFINMSESLLMSDVIEILPKDKIVMEILETVKINHALVERCKLLKNMGFEIALDDLTVYDPEMDPFLELADVVKIDILMVEPSALEKLAEKIKHWPVKLLAEKVDSIEQFEHCKAIGFDLFQGYYFARPQIIKGKRLSLSELTLMKLLGQVMADAQEHEIEETLKGNPHLSLNLLRLTNSVACGVRQKVSSIRSAITILGRRQLQRWIQILLYSSSSQDHTFPNPILQLAATRGKMMELLSPTLGCKELEDNAFVTGIMSLMDTLLGTPMSEILTTIPVSQEVKDALIERNGVLGRLLNLVESLEKGDMTVLEERLKACTRITLRDLSAAQAEALKWSNSISQPNE